MQLLDIYLPLAHTQGGPLGEAEITSVRETVLLFKLRDTNTVSFHWLGSEIGVQGMDEIRIGVEVGLYDLKKVMNNTIRRIPIKRKK